MIKLSLNQAAKEAKTAKATLLKAIRDGRMSAPKNDKGYYEIDPAELFRVYPPTPEKPVSEPVSKPTPTPSYPPLPPENRFSETSLLEAKIEAMEARFSDAQQTIEDLRKRLDEEATERRDTQRMLTHITHQEQQATKKSFWARLFG